MVKMMFIAFPIILAVTVPVFSQSITVNTTSGRLLGAQDAGGAQSLSESLIISSDVLGQWHHSKAL
jgi:hypothetical protein